VPLIQGFYDFMHPTVFVNFTEAVVLSSSDVVATLRSGNKGSLQLLLPSCRMVSSDAEAARVSTLAVCARTRAQVVVDSMVFISLPTFAPGLELRTAVTVRLPRGAFMSTSGAPTPPVLWEFVIDMNLTILQSPTEVGCAGWECGGGAP
jgi:hypothetical protein